MVYENIMFFYFKNVIIQSYFVVMQLTDIYVTSYEKSCFV